MNALRCPVCHLPLNLFDTTYRCEKGHCFDRSSSGYVNLLLPNRRHSQNPGDSKEMILARSRFLKGGYYDFLRDALLSLIARFLEGRPNPTLADIGCGEGYYTRAFGALLGSLGGSCYGFDLSKDGLKLAAKADPVSSYGVASLGEMPLLDGSLDLLINVFAPYNSAEFARVLKNDGLLITAVPAEDHLFGLKSALYERPYQNVLAPYEMADFSLHSSHRITKTATISPTQDILDLFAMTPYYWKTSKAAAEGLATLPSLTTPLDFGIFVYEKKETL